jgi:hypothetical protein
MPTAAPTMLKEQHRETAERTDRHHGEAGEDVGPASTIRAITSQ